MLKTVSASAIALAGCVLTLFGCGAGEGGANPPAAEASEPTSARASEPAAARTSRTTAAGAELKIGDRAILPHTKGTIAITVTEVNPGDRNAFLQQYGERARDIVPYYIHFTIENVEGDDPQRPPPWPPQPTPPTADKAALLDKPGHEPGANAAGFLADHHQRQLAARTTFELVPKESPTPKATSA